MVKVVSFFYLLEKYFPQMYDSFFLIRQLHWKHVYS